MKPDEEEFFTICGGQENRCNRNVELTIIHKGETLVDGLEVACGLTTTADGDSDFQCTGCDRYILPCVCGNGLALQTVNPKVQVCTNDNFCYRDNVSTAALEKLDEV